MKIVDRIRGRVRNVVDAYRELTADPLEDEGGAAPRISHRFKVTTGETPPRVLFVYGYDGAEARRRLPESVPVVSFEPAGDVVDGVLNLPEAEVREVMGSVMEGRVAPGSSLKG